MELPIIELFIEDLEDGVETTALVLNPAIQKSFMAFNEQTALKLEIHNEEKMILAGALIVPDFPMYRNINGKEFFVKFSKETIEKILDRIILEGKLMNFNLEHNNNNKISNVHFQQMFIINSEMGINTPKGLEPLADGTLFVFAKVNDKEIWETQVKTGLVTGFSIEGLFSHEDLTFSEQIKELEKQLETNNMSNLKLKAEDLLKKINAKLGFEESGITYETEKLTDGTPIKWVGKLAEKTEVFLEDGSKAPDGEHTFESGVIIVVLDGVVQTIAEPIVEDATEVAMSKILTAIEGYQTKLAEMETKLNAKLEAFTLAFGKKEVALSSQISATVETQKEIFTLQKTMLNDSKSPKLEIEKMGYLSMLANKMGKL